MELVRVAVHEDLVAKPVGDRLQVLLQQPAHCLVTDREGMRLALAEAPLGQSPPEGVTDRGDGLLDFGR